MGIIFVYNLKYAQKILNKVLNNTSLILLLLKGVWSKWNKFGANYFVGLSSKNNRIMVLQNVSFSLPRLYFQYCFVRYEISGARPSFGS